MPNQDWSLSKYKISDHWWDSQSKQYEPTHIFSEFCNLIARDELPAMLEKMRKCLVNYPKLNDAI